MGRPLFLLGSASLYLTGSAMAWHQTAHLRLSLLVLGLLLVWAVQLMTHYNNEYWDLETDRATEKPTLFSGGSRVLVRGLVPPRVARGASIACLVWAVALALVLVLGLGAGPATLALAGVAILGGWLYSAPPIKLEARRLGEICIVMVSAFLVPAMGYYLQTSSPSPKLALLGLPLGLLVLALTLASELPDMEADRATGKMTLAASLGLKRVLGLQGVSLAIGWLSLVAVTTYVVPSRAWLVAAGGPLALIGLTCLPGVSRGRLPALERLGLANSLALGYSALALSGALFLS